MLRRRYEAVLDDRHYDSHDTERDGRVPRGWRNGKFWARDGHGDGSPRADVRGGETAAGLAGEVVDTRVGGGKKYVHAYTHEDGYDGTNHLGIELDAGGGTE